MLPGAPSELRDDLIDLLDAARRESRSDKRLRELLNSLPGQAGRPKGSKNDDPDAGLVAEIIRRTEQGESQADVIGELAPKVLPFHSITSAKSRLRAKVRARRRNSGE